MYGRKRRGYCSRRAAIKRKTNRIPGQWSKRAMQTFDAEKNGNPLNWSTDFLLKVAMKEALRNEHLLACGQL